jgi:hypothetical protein
MSLWPSFFSMLEDIRKHVQAGEQVTLVDDAFRLRLGFRGEASEWDIELASVKRAKPSTPEEQRFCELFRTLEGRRQLLKHFERGSLRKTIWEHLKESN